MKYRQIINDEFDVHMEMKRRGLTLRLLQNESGIDFSYIQRIVAGKVIPTEGMAKRLQDAIRAFTVPSLSLPQPRKGKKTKVKK